MKATKEVRRQAILESIIKGQAHEIGRISPLFEPDLIRMSPDLRRELLLSINNITGMSEVVFDMDGHCFIFGLQIQVEPLFKGLTFRIESGSKR